MTDQLPLVSVVMPMYNIERYVRNTLRSVASQSWRNLEVVLVDDGSTDATSNIALRAAEKLGLRCILHSGSNRGVSVARNIGTELASGNFIIHLDADDLLDPKAVEDSVTFMLENRLDAAVMNFCYVDELCVNWEAGSTCGNSVLSQRDALDAHLFRSLNMAAPAFVVTKSFALAHPYRETVCYSEDIQHVWDVLLAVDSVGYIGTDRYGYRRRPGSTMTGSSLEKVECGIVDFRSFAETLPADKVNPRWVYGRWLFGTLHAVSKRISWDDFKRLAEVGRLRIAAHQLNDFPQLRFRGLAKLALLSPYSLYLCLSRI